MFGAAIKAVGQWTLDVRVAFGSPARKDAHGEWFDDQTDFAEEHYPMPPAVYYHGHGEDKRPERKPDYLGKATQRTVKADGIWYRVELNPAKPRSAKMMQAAREGKAVASPGTIHHMIRRAPNGHLEHWPIVELSIFDTYDGQRPANPYSVAIPAIKAVYTEAGLALPVDIDRPDHPATGEQHRAAPANGHPDTQSTKALEDRSMNEDEIKAAIKAAMDARDAATAAAKAEEDRIEAEVAKRTAAKAAELEQKAAAGNRLAFGGGDNGQGQAPTALKFADVAKFDNLDLGAQALLVGVLSAAQRSGRGDAPSEAAMKALAIKAGEDKTWVGERARNGMKAAGLDPALATATKADELNRTGLSSYGAEWVSDAWSNALWEKIRFGAGVVQNIPTIEIPQGADSITIPYDTNSLTFYKVAETADLNATTGRPNATVPSSRRGTANRTISTTKVGARAVWSGEMTEDGLAYSVEELKRDLELEGAEVMDHLAIDGDSETAVTTNINHIGGTPGATDAFLSVDGFRKLALITNTANARDGGVLALEDFLETVKLMGAAGLNALDVTKVAMIVDPLTYYKALTLTQVSTRDLYSSPTIEGGQLTSLYGYQLIRTGNICRMATANRLSNAAGKVDQTTPANNTKGSIVAVRWDQWRMAFKRRMTMEVSRFPESDANQIVALFRIGLKYRDTEASAVSYNLTV